jgi:alkanesulfonate monooxygenase SsuD/methylene tetrahydromethanopterin reductase-like flavin-dependent oxidoreductase (luciferase family)
MPVGLHTLSYVAETDEEAIETQWPHWRDTFARASRERGWRPPTRAQFDAEVEHGALFVGSPETVATRLASVMRDLEVERLGVHYAIGKVPYDKRAESIRLLGTEVYPRVRELLAADPPVHDSPEGGPSAVPNSPVRATHAPGTSS